MPLYEYKCPKCGGIVQKVRAADDRDLPVRHCGVECKRIIGYGVRFQRGTGWHARAGCPMGPSEYWGRKVRGKPGV
jgi:putative FmdB family regulatory protein